MTKQLLIKLSSSLLLILAILTFFKIVSLYNKVYRANFFTPNEKPVYVYIPTGSTFDDVLKILESNVRIKNKKTFLWVVEKKNYKNKVRPGKFKIKNRSNNNELINRLRAGWQEPVLVTFNNIRFSHELAKRIGNKIEATESDLLAIFKNEEVIASCGFTKETFQCMFIPNSYELFWNTSADKFVERMHIEYKRFWNEKRKEKAEIIGLTPVEVSILASIVDQETQKKDEKARVAGLYINRLNKNIRLHADPTIKYALGDFSVKRILKKHLSINSPYNTYRHSGLPPGPICFPSTSGIDAVLNYEKHKYLYMCAREDFSGYHNFATNLKDHNHNAAKYQKALNKKRIYR